MTRTKLSIIITAHREGFLAHKTMRSLLAGLAPFDQHKIPYEIIIHIDNGTSDTKEYFSRYESDKRCTIYNNNFKDPGLSRNFAISKAKGDFVTVTDADDILSANWLKTAYDIVAKAKQPVIVHPFACLTFGIGVKPVLNFYGPSLGKDKDALVLLGENRWGIVVMAPREIFLRFPYIASKDGYGHEDYYFSTSTVEAGIKHLIAPETVLFYRRGNHSVLDGNNAAGVVQPYSKLFDEVQPPLNERQLGQEIQTNRRSATYRTLQHLYHTSLRHLPFKEGLKQVAYRFVSQKRRYNQDEQIVIREWRKANRFDALLCPTREQLDQLSYYSELQGVDCGIKYYELMGKFKQKPDYIFIVPWVDTGGADKVLINYAKAIQELRPSSRILVITTLMSGNQFRKFLPDNVDFVDFGNATVDLHPFLKDRLLSRIIIQSQCRKVHIINSEYAYDWVKNHLDFAKHGLDLRISTFNYDFVAGLDGCIFDYNDMYLPLIYPAVKHIYTDNHRVLEHISTRCGIDIAAKATVHYQPIPADEIQPITHDTSPHRPLRVLWASRIVKQKAPELLISTAQALSAQDFHIDMYGTMSAPFSARDFQLPTLTYRGPYDGIASLDTTQYDIFLYTSLGDGMPNILLEMVARGLPVITSDVGGISELIKDGQTGTLIDNNNPKLFVSALRDARSHYDKYLTMAIAAQDLLRTQHGEAEFVKNVKKMIL